MNEEMIYELTVVKRKRNPEFKPGQYFNGTSEFIDVRAMSVHLTIAEFQQMKEALLRSWESGALFIRKAMD